MRRTRTAAVLLSTVAMLALGACSADELPEDLPVPPKPAIMAAATGTWIDGTFSSIYGARFYRVYIPSTYTGTARPMMVMLHGCLQDGYDFAAGTRMNSFAESRNFIVLYPEQGTAYNPGDCWNWFYTSNQVRGSGEPSVIAGMIDWVKAHYAIDSNRVGVAGFSAGAAMATIMACTYPDRVRKLAEVAGVQYGAATTSSGGTNAMLFGSIYDPNAMGTDCSTRQATGGKRVIPTLVFHGTADGTVNPVNAAQTTQQWTQTNDLADGSDNGNVDYTADATVTGTACRAYTRYDYNNSANGQTVVRRYVISGMDHRWPGGSSAGTYTDACAPDASQIIVDFFGF
ncbi:PHB depolymerase family esterase [Longimicrobium sp.]|uniref:extracellular catalytic domain type 1 short-chain-length polyhydroxyalkanoate depolymerase n=1 Tax=Longimicrobium sp. TaxID=2029185 RepID=UPI002C41621E|nr:PHB depolymerase family esterase [Longimicrobium sp.]HSU12741.1 PHB depolymerase family esterase [Longimicrobium sp.]